MKKFLSLLAVSALFAASSARATLVDVTDFDPAVGINGGISFSAGTATLSGTASLTGSVGHLNSFDWIFSTSDYLPFDDFAWVRLAGTQYTLSSVGLLGSTGEGTVTTGWQTFTFDTPFDGAIEFGVANVRDDAVPSSFAIRNIDGTAVPEPATYGLLGGLVLIGLLLRRSRKA